ncbi:TM0106 family RecB-like putative nuclease [Candidatus Uhrbacteria bacterium]|nr:TM0106 family RecB-like putative nuclease [Candidatus Uhrbacteria bacterium]
MKKDFLTATDFYRLTKCPHWPYFERFATAAEKKLKRKMTDAEKKRLEDGLKHEAKVVRKLFKGVRAKKIRTTTHPEKDFQTTLAAMREGVPLIYQGTLLHGDWTGRPDLLERQEGASSFGAWHYVPVDVKSSHELQKYQKLQLTFYASLLERVQGRFPARPAILNSDGERMDFVAADMLREFEETVVELERIRAGERPDPVLRKDCFDTGPWGAACERLATFQNDIALLYNVDVRKLRALRGIGIRTLDDAAGMDPFALDGAAPGLRLHGLEVCKLQAQSLLHRRVFVREPVVLPSRGLEIHFDIESDLPNDMDYLYGFLIREPAGDRYASFVAESLGEEAGMWRRFLDWIGGLPEEFTVYHFGAFEKTRLGVMEKRHGGSPALERFRDAMIDLRTLTSSSVVFPIYFYGLKTIAPFLGFRWKGSVKGGSQSIDVYERFLKTRKRKLLDDIISYNEEDVRATALLKDWLVAYAGKLAAYDPPFPWTTVYSPKPLP